MKINKGNKSATKGEKQEANTCIALGATVGALGSASVVIGGALCPLCLVVAPGLVGLGLYTTKTPG